MIAIEGNIGAGKTTLCQTLMDRLGGPEKVVVLKEEIVGHWQLDAFYREPQRYAYALHKLTIKLNRRTMEQASIAASAGKIVLMDRCLLGVWVFINANLGNMTPVQAVKITNRFRQAMVDVPKPDLIIHLNTGPEQCAENAKKRARSCDATVGIEYLKQLDQYYHEIIGTWPGVAVMPMEFDLITDENIAKIRACQPYLVPPPKDDYPGSDSEDSDPLSDTWSFSDEKAD
jgi:deoxyadenosine/deoxycytidine kinase